MLSIYHAYTLLLSCIYAYSLSECPLTQLQHHERSVFSQNGEDGVLLAILDIIGVKHRTYVEFGVEDGKQCNSRLLRERYNFTGLMMDGGFSNERINLQQEFITADNILHLFQKHNVQKNFDVLSVDVDMFDWWILARILGAGGYRPRVIIAEVNPTLGVAGPSLRYLFHEANALPLVVHHPASTNQTMWDFTRYCGGNPKAFQKLGRRFGYEMVYCENCGVNCFLIDRTELQAISSCQLDDDVGGTPEHWPLPKLSYPCHGFDGQSYVGHHIDNILNRRPILITDDVLDDAVQDSLPVHSVAAISAYMKRHEFPLLEVSEPIVPEHTTESIDLTVDEESIDRFCGQSPSVAVSLKAELDDYMDALHDQYGILTGKSHTGVFLCRYLQEQKWLTRTDNIPTCEIIADKYWGVMVALFSAGMVDDALAALHEGLRCYRFVSCFEFSTNFLYIGTITYTKDF
mmetsp:Transcript_7896/g.11770  ORF Transcript_7896/g.11770 Transcript_7896/m.11770 type:complete len:460 (+) Transcript_7896:21-1400(+)